MFLARIDGLLTATVKHPNLEGASFLIAQRLEGDGTETGDPFVVIDQAGAPLGSTVLVSTDGDIVRKKHGNNVPGRMVVVGLVDYVNGRPV